MRDLLKNIFNNADFNVIEEVQLVNEKTFLAISRIDCKVNYYLVVFIKENVKNFLEEADYSAFLEYMKNEVFYNSNMEKNFSLLVCLNYNKEIDVEMQKDIYEIEENPYDFKKYVLIYSDEQVQMLSKELLLPKYRMLIPVEGIKNVLNKILIDNARFYNFKNYMNDTVYDLITKIFIKLPFLSTEIGKEKQMENLQEKIKNKLDEELNELKKDCITYGNLLEEDEEEQILKKIYAKGGIIID
ncbi:ABC-three component system middle component 1 [Bacillus sp. 22475]|uniref:ABC-three component system middle component 1 n=1 Tax=Bacillus sp. 22475 TaxID=3453925 RepID=UPI003F84963B